MTDLNETPPTGPSDTTIATVRTTWNTSVLAAISMLLYKIFGWDISVDDLLPFMPLIIPVVSVFYRLSVLVSSRWPAVGRVLFGVNKSPVYALGA